MKPSHFNPPPSHRYYANISASIDRDDYFETMMNSAWKMGGIYAESSYKKKGLLVETGEVAAKKAEPVKQNTPSENEHLSEQRERALVQAHDPLESYEFGQQATPVAAEQSTPVAAEQATPVAEKAPTPVAEKAPTPVAEQDSVISESPAPRPEQRRVSRPAAGQPTRRGSAGEIAHESPRHCSLKSHPRHPS
eukprot:gene14093-4134_t